MGVGATLGASLGVYLFRNLGSVWAIAVVSSLLQIILSVKLPIALEGIAGKNEVLISCCLLCFLIAKIIEAVRHSAEYIKTIENHEVRRGVLLVFVFGIRSTLLLRVV
jgi:hypothetical protein